MRLDHLLSKDYFGIIPLGNENINACCSVLKVHRKMKIFKNIAPDASAFVAKLQEANSAKFSHDVIEVSCFVL